MNLKLRARGLASMLVGAVICLVVLNPHSGLARLAIGAAPTAAIFLMAGLIEFLTGMPFYKVAQKWDSMPVWIQFPLGMGIVAAALVVPWTFVK